tara:strand:+ start:796 stop:1707 length:912 start_codon:yes stop_codon:yes gene_type:complete
MKKQLQQTSSFLYQKHRYSLLILLLTCCISTFSQEHFAYIERGDSLLQLSLYASEKTENMPSKRPQSLVLFVHGGGFSSGSRLQRKNVLFCQALKEIGLTVASIDYRLRQKNQGFHCDVSIEEKREAIAWAAEDILAAWDYLHNFGYQTVILAGSSAGAEAALHAAYHIGSEDIEAVISIAGAMEPAPADAPNIPLLAFHGECDQLVPYGESMHHGCPEESPGALLLQGGGALAHCSAQTRLISYENKGHELTGELLSDVDALNTIGSFISDIRSQSIIAQRIRIASDSDSPCSTPQNLGPCQ